MQTTPFSHTRTSGIHGHLHVTGEQGVNQKLTPHHTHATVHDKHMIYSLQGACMICMYVREHVHMYVCVCPIHVWLLAGHGGGVLCELMWSRPPIAMWSVWQLPPTIT